MTPSYFERSSGHLVEPLWILRGFGLAILASLAAALLLFKSGGAHAFCVGLAGGLTVGLVAQLFALSSVTLKDAPDRSDVEHLPITR